MSKKIRVGMIGGGQGAFIGEVHRRAFRLDDRFQLVGGAFDADPARGRAFGLELGLDPARLYDNYEALIRGESALPPEERIELVSVVTPNFLHFPIADALAAAGFHVMCEKPMTLNSDEAAKLAETVRRSGTLFAVMHNYIGYPMVKLARDLVRAGKLGKLRKITVRYAQEWLCRPVEHSGNAQAAWRTNRKLSGGGCISDIGGHAFNLAEYVSGRRAEALCADLTTFVPDRQVDDDCSILLRFDDGMRGVLLSTQTAPGRLNDLEFELCGEKASLVWQQLEPEKLIFRPWNEPEQIWHRGSEYVKLASPAAARAARLAAGHPDGFIAAFANHYFNLADCIEARRQGSEPGELSTDYPGIAAGVRVAAFIDAALSTLEKSEKWIKVG